MPENVLKATISVTAPGVKETFAQVANSTKAAEGNLNQLGTTVAKTEAIVRQMPPAVTETTLTLKDQRAILAALQRQYAALSTEQAKSRIGRELAADIKIANAEIKRLEVGAVSSFGAIGKSATKGFSAIRQLAFILPGIGIAGIFNLAFTAIEKLISGFDSLSKKTQLYKDISDQLAKGVAEDLTKLTSLVGLVQNVNTSNDDRVKGLKALNEQYAQYLPNLDKEGITLQNVAAAYDKIVDALLRQAVVKGLQKEIQAEVEKTASQIIRFREAEERRRLASEQANKATGDTTTAIQAAGQKLQQYNQIVRDGTQALAGRTAELKRNATNFGATSIERLTAELKAQLAPLLKLTTDFDDLDIKLNGEKQVGTEVDKIIAHAKRLLAEFGKLNEIHLDILPVFSELDTKAEQLKKAQQIIKDVSEFFNDFSSKQRALKLVIPIAPVPLLIPPDPAQTALTQKEITEILKSVANFKPEVEVPFDLSLKIAKEFDDFKKKLNLDLAAHFSIIVDPEGLTQAQKALLDLTRQSVFAADTITSVLTPAFQGLFDAILSGEDPLKSFFDGLGQAVQQLIQKLVAAAVQALILSAIFGSIGGASGFGAIFGKLLGFEKGGSPPVGKDVLVGEKRTEIFVPNVGQPVLLGVGGPHLFRADRPGKIIPKVGKATSVFKSISTNTDKQQVVIRDISKEISSVLQSVAATLIKQSDSVLRSVVEKSTQRVDSNQVFSVNHGVFKILDRKTDKLDKVSDKTDKSHTHHIEQTGSKYLISKEVYNKISDVFRGQSHKEIENNSSLSESFARISDSVKQISIAIERVITTSNTSDSTNKISESKDSRTWETSNTASKDSTIVSREKTSDRQSDQFVSTVTDKIFSSLIDRNVIASLVEKTSEGKTTVKKSDSAFAYFVEKDYSNFTDTTKLIRESFATRSDSFNQASSNEKTISTGFDKLTKIVTSDKKDFVHESINTFQSLVTNATSSLKELFSTFKNSSLVQKDSSVEKSSVFESFTTKIANTFSSVLERIIDRLKPQPIPAVSSNITKILTAASTLNNLTFMARGGEVGKNTPTIVGERGAEFFMPSVSGTIIPHHKLASFTKHMKELSSFSRFSHTEKEINIFKSSKAFKELSSISAFKDLTKMSHKELKKMFGSTFDGGRAGGGFIRGGNLVLVGERGREAFIPNIGQSITNNNNSVGGISSFAGGANHKVVFEIAGQTLVGVLTLGQQQLRRLS